MISWAVHNIKIPFRHLIAAGMAALYLTIIFSPLGQLAMHSKTVAHAVTGECVGDCDICGCSPQSRANHTCCCAKKKKQLAHVHEEGEDGTPDCCKKKPLEKKTVIACGCPCGSGKQATLSASSTSEVLPFHFSEQFSLPHTDTTFANPTYRLTSRLGDPPEPPPKLSSIS